MRLEVGKQLKSRNNLRSSKEIRGVVPGCLMGRDWKDLGFGRWALLTVANLHLGVEKQELWGGPWGKTGETKWDLLT